MTNPGRAFHPELRLARVLPSTVVTPRTVGATRRLTRLMGRLAPRGGERVRVDADVSVRVFRPTRASSTPMPALVWMHGGGYVIGSAAMSDAWCRRVADELGIVAVSVDYRLAPQHPFPAPLDDCHRALVWASRQPAIDPSRIAIGGESAGGGLAAALALLAAERGEVLPVAQVLSYPMLDDRTALRQETQQRLRLWNQNSNRLGWRAYLGDAYGGDVPPLAAPARHDDLTRVPPAWIGVGTEDLFYDEDLAYAARLREAGVPCALHVVQGAYHGFDLVEGRAPVAKAFRAAQVAALREAFGRDT